MKYVLVACLGLYFLITGMITWPTISLAWIIGGIGLLTFSNWGKRLAIIICLIQAIGTLLLFALSSYSLERAEKWSEKQTDAYYDNNGAYHYQSFQGGRDEKYIDTQKQNQKIYTANLVKLAVILALLNFDLIIKFFRIKPGRTEI